MSQHDAEAVIETWLKQRLRREAFENTFGGAVFVVIGLVVQAIVSYCTAFVTLMVLFRVMAVLSLLNRETNLLKPSIIVGSVVLFLVLSAGGALRYRHSLGYSQRKVSVRSSLGEGDVLRGLVTLVCEILFAGPRLILVGSEDMARAWAQWRADRTQLASMLNWLLAREHKVPLPELSAEFGSNGSLLRLVPGVIWLQKEEGVVILSEELRNDLQRKIPQGVAP